MVLGLLDLSGLHIAYMAGLARESKHEWRVLSQLVLGCMHQFRGAMFALSRAMFGMCTAPWLDSTSGPQCFRATPTVPAVAVQ